MKATKIVGIIVLLLLLETKARAIGAFDTTTTGTTKSIYLTAPVIFTNPSYVLGFVAFESGFTIPSSYTFQFGSVGNVGGTINLNNGTLQLTDDLHLGSSSIFVGPGTIDLNGHSIISSAQTSFSNSVTILNSTGNGGFIGNGGSLLLGSATLNLSGASNLFFLSIIISGITSTNFLTNSSPISFYNVILNLNSSISFPFIFNPTLSIQGSCEINGLGAYIILPNGMYVNSSSFLTMGDETTAQLSGATIDGAGISGKLQLNNATLEFTQNSYLVSQISLLINGNSTIASSSPNGIVLFGSHSSTYDTELFVNPGSKLAIINGTTIQYNCAD